MKEHLMIAILAAFHAREVVLTRLALADVGPELQTSDGDRTLLEL